MVAVNQLSLQLQGTPSTSGMHMVNRQNTLNEYIFKIIFGTRRPQVEVKKNLVEIYSNPNLS